MKTIILLAAAASLFLATSCSHMKTSRSGSAARPMTYGEATEAPLERYGGRPLDPHPGAANYDPTTGRGQQ